MDQRNLFVTLSLELHLFFARIMKEHALFLEAGFTPANADFAKRAEQFREKFEKVLGYCTDLSRGRVQLPVLQSGEIVTEYTDQAEHQTEHYTGISIDEAITHRQLALCQFNQGCEDGEIFTQVQQLNQDVLCLLENFIAFKSQVLENVRHCQMFTLNYPLLIEHILREAKMYASQLSNYQKGTFSCEKCSHHEEMFWNQIMMEHALFIRGSLDPSENQMIQTANQFVGEYEQLLQNNGSLWKESSARDETIRFRDFKKAGIQGIIHCHIQSVILPLLADHVLREANHYLRLLNC